MAAEPSRPLSPQTLAAIRAAVLDVLAADPEAARRLRALVEAAVLDLAEAAPTRPVEVGAAQAQAILDVVEKKVRVMVRPDALRRP